MIVAPAKAGKTMVLQAVAEGVVKNYPNATVFILLVDERPEEVTEMEMCGYGEVVASSFDHPGGPARGRGGDHAGAGPSQGGDGQGRRHHPRLDHAPGAGVQHERAQQRQDADGRPGLERAGEAEAVPGQCAQHRPEAGRRLAHDHCHGAGRDGLADGRRDLRGVQGHGQQRAGAEPRAGGQAHLAGHRPDGQRHAP
jgi:hypothetical protein